MVWDPKDPWGKRSDSIDDVLRQYQGQLSQMMPSKGIRSLLLLLLLVVMVWQGTFIVAPDEEGVVKRFGDVVRTAGPGPHLKIPFIETVLRPKVEKLHRLEIGFRTDRQNRVQVLPQEAQMLTDDLNIIAVEFIVQYKIKNARDYLFRVDEIEDTIE
jgi:membrane protease subunit HflK